MTLIAPRHGSFETLFRRRIVDRLRLALEAPVSLIIAPPGYGKSVAVRQLLGVLESPSASYELRSDNAQLLGFVRGFADAFSAINPLLARTVVGAYEACQNGDAPSELASWFCAHVEHFAGVIFIDDFHVSAQSEPVCAFLSQVIAHAQRRIKWIIATRVPGSLPLAQWQAAGLMMSPLDERDLELTLAEAGEIATLSGTPLSTDDLTRLFAQTEGYPTAFRFACDLWARADESFQPAGVRAITYRFLAEQVYGGLSQSERDLLLAACVYPRLNVELLERAGFAGCAQTIAALREKTSFLQVESDGMFRIHDLFRDFLEHELRAHGEAALTKTLTAAGAVLEAAGDIANALLCFVRAHAGGRIALILATRGFELIDQGRIDIVEEALDSLRDEERDYPLLAALYAVAQWRKGRLELAEPAFDRALRMASESADRAWVAYHFARLLGDIDPIRAAALLAGYAGCSWLPDDLQALICSHYAQMTATDAEGVKRAGEPLRRALELASTVDREDVRAAVYVRAAWIALSVTDYDRAAEFANRSVQSALSSGCLQIAASAYTALAFVAHSGHERSDRCRANLELAEDCARRAGDMKNRLVALSHLAALEARTANHAALGDIDARFAVLNRRSSDLTVCSLAESRALRTSWTGDFTASCQALMHVRTKGLPAIASGLHHARIALHAAASGQRDHAERVLTQAQAAMAQLARLRDKPPVIETAIICTLAQLVLGKMRLCEVGLQRIEAMQPTIPRRLRALLKATRALYAQAHSGLAEGEVRIALAELHALDFGGYALLLERLPLPNANAGAAVLTEAELQVLYALARGETSREIAERTGRKRSTIEGHVTSICRKLGTKNRRRAIAGARERGILPAK